MHFILRPLWLSTIMFIKMIGALFLFIGLRLDLFYLLLKYGYLTHSQFIQNEEMNFYLIYQYLKFLCSLDQFKQKLDYSDFNIEIF